MLESGWPQDQPPSVQPLGRCEGKSVYRVALSWIRVSVFSLGSWVTGLGLGPYHYGRLGKMALGHDRHQISVLISSCEIAVRGRGPDLQ